MEVKVSKKSSLTTTCKQDAFSNSNTDHLQINTQLGTSMHQTIRKHIGGCLNNDYYLHQITYQGKTY